MKRPRCLQYILLLFTPMVVMAEGRCPSGMFETGSRDYLACAPIPGYGQGSDNGYDDSPPVPMVWAKRWGAFAGESNGSGFGAVNGSGSESAAKQAALSQCQATASDSKNRCKVLLSFYNQCGAYAWGGGGGITASAVDLATAKERALKSCSASSGVTCKIYSSGCSFAEAVPE